MPFVSICIPTYRNQISLRRLLDSIRCQDYADYEVIVCDDTPGLDVWNVVAAFTDLPGFQYQRNNPRLGSPANWNCCLDLAAGTWIKIMHHDDWFSTASSLRQFADLAAAVQGSPLIFSACNAYRNGETLDFVHAPFGLGKGVRQLPLLSAADLIFANQIGCPSVTLFRHDSGLRFDPALLWLVDVDFYVSAISQGGAWLISRPLINVTFDADTQITSSVEHDQALRMRETLYLGNKHHLLQSPVLVRRFLALCESLALWPLLRIWLESFAWKPQPLPLWWPARLLLSRSQAWIGRHQPLFSLLALQSPSVLRRALRALASRAGLKRHQR